ncbi:MAG: hypothetical protein WEA10_08405 [Actinomycetota bacterium]
MREEHGLVSKAILIFLVLIVLVGIALIDGSSILITRYRISDLAQKAAFDGAAALRNTESAEAACNAAEAALTDQTTTATMTKDGCTIEGDEVTITLKDTASTIIVERLGFLADLATSKTSATSAGPSA